MEKSSGQSQFGLRAMLWTVVVIAMTLAFLRRLNSPTVFLQGTHVVVLAAIVGGVFGVCAGRMGDGAYWSVIIATAAFLSVAGERAYSPVFPLAWSAVGAATGTCCGLIPQNRLLLRMLGGAIAAGTTMLVLAPNFASRDVEALFDLACAPVVGGLVGLLIEIILWLERNSVAPRYVTASWLLCAVIVGNLLVPVAIH